MITLDNLKQVQEQLNFLGSICKKYENEQIKLLLHFFKIPEKKSENIMSIEELLESEVILILTPKELFENVDFKKFKFPSKIKLQPNTIDNTFKIFGFDDLMSVKIELPFLPIVMEDLLNI